MCMPVRPTLVGIGSGYKSAYLETSSIDVNKALTPIKVCLKFDLQVILEGVVIEKETGTLECNCLRCILAL